VSPPLRAMYPCCADLSLCSVWIPLFVSLPLCGPPSFLDSSCSQPLPQVFGPKTATALCPSNLPEACWPESLRKTPLLLIITSPLTHLAFASKMCACLLATQKGTGVSYSATKNFADLVYVFPETSGSFILPETHGYKLLDSFLR
jgi:hypothetical protein